MLIALGALFDGDRLRVGARLGPRGRGGGLQLPRPARGARWARPTTTTSSLRSGRSSPDGACSSSGATTSCGTTSPARALRRRPQLLRRPLRQAATGPRRRLPEVRLRLGEPDEAPPLPLRDHDPRRVRERPAAMAAPRRARRPASPCGSASDRSLHGARSPRAPIRAPFFGAPRHRAMASRRRVGPRRHSAARRWRAASGRRDPTVTDGSPATATLRLPRGRWELSLQYDASRDVRVTAPGFEATIPANLDYRGSTPYYGVPGELAVTRRGPVRVTVSVERPPLAGRLLGASSVAHLGAIAATPARPGEHGLPGDGGRRRSRSAGPAAATSTGTASAVSPNVPHWGLWRVARDVRR